MPALDVGSLIINTQTISGLKAVDTVDETIDILKLCLNNDNNNNSDIIYHKR